MVIIVNSPLFREKNHLYDEDSLPPLGLGYITTSLQANGIEVQLIDAVDQRIPLVDLIDSLNFIKPEFIGLNIFTTNYKLVKEIVEELNFKTKIIIGGLATKELNKDILKWETENQIDIVIGDGENIIIDIIKEQVQEAPIKTNEKMRVFEVNTASRYYVKNISNVPLNRRFFLNEPIKHPLGFIEANIVASRGCIYNCKFCAAARSLNRQFSIRERSAESIKNELQNIIDNYPSVNSIRVLDDLFLKNVNDIIKAVEIFGAYNLKWRSMAHVQTFKDAGDHIMAELKKSGCTEIFIGIESGSPKILQSINKTSNTNIVKRNISRVFKAGINIKGYFIYGFPKETEEDMKMTYELASELHKMASKYGSKFRTSVFQFRPYHATELYNELKLNGIDASVNSIEPNEELSDLVGRIQFNFHNGNYSEVDLSVVHDYIYRTTNLNNLGIPNSKRRTFKSRKVKKM